jgi:hypothetical protein
MAVLENKTRFTTMYKSNTVSVGKQVSVLFVIAAKTFVLTELIILLNLVSKQTLGS